MIGQHIYSRCTEGYFSKSSSTADSTTVTISKNMFSNEEQAYRVARKCESICPLEDVRPVPSNLTGIYHGVFKIKQLSKQLTLICRSYRLGADQSMSANERGVMQRAFSYSSSYILSGAERDKFFHNPEYLLNLQDYEAYPSVRKRIADSQMTEARGKIEADPSYSIFKHAPREMDYSVFEKAGFTRKLFAEYITSILQRIYLSKKNGVLGGKVLVVLPSRFRPDWNQTGGNPYAEGLIAATLKVLPFFARHEVNAISCGGSNPDSSILEEFQLIFMESGFDSSWIKSEYSIFDLERGKSYVPEGMDISVGEMIWDNLRDENTRQIFDNTFLDLMGKERAYLGDKRAEMYSFVLHLMEGDATQYSDPVKRNQILISFITFFAGRWSAQTEELFQKILQIENKDPQLSKVLENKMLMLFMKKEYLPESCLSDIVQFLFYYIIKDNASEQTIKMFTERLVEKNFETEQQLIAFNKHVSQSNGAEWFENNSLNALFWNICERKEIAPESEIKMTVTNILIKWYDFFARQNDLKHCAMILNTLSEQLSNTNISLELREHIYHNLFTLLFSGSEQGMHAAAELIQKERSRIMSDSGKNLDLYAKTMISVMIPENTSQPVCLNRTALDFFFELAVLGNENFIQEYFKPGLQKYIQRYGMSHPELVYNYTVDKLVSLYQVNPKQNYRVISLIYYIIQVFIQQGPEKYQLRNSKLQQISALFQKNRFAFAGLLLMQMKAFPSENHQKNYFQELSADDRRCFSILAMHENYQEQKYQIYLNQYVSKREILEEIQTNFAKQPDIKTKLYQIYANKMLQEFGPNELESIECICRKYMTEIRSIGKAEPEFMQVIKDQMYSHLIRCNSLQVYTLSMNELQVLKNEFHLPDQNTTDSDWKSIDQVIRFYSVQDVQGIIQFQRELSQRGWSESRCYEQLIGKRLEEEVKQFFSSAGTIEEPIVFNESCYLWAILYSFVKNGYFEIMTCFNALGIGRHQTKSSKIACVFMMAALSENLADGEFIFKPCMNQLRAYRDIEVYCNDTLAELYKHYFRADALDLGSLLDLPNEWREKYGMFLLRGNSGVLISLLVSLLIAIPFVVAGGLMGFFAEESILYIIGIIALVIGCIGMLIWAIISMINSLRR